MKFAFRTFALVWGLLCGLPSGIPALAQSATKAKPQAEGGAKGTGWIATIGGGSEYGPSYQGAKEETFTFVPSFDIRRLGEPAGFSAPDDGVDYSLIELGGLELGPVVGLRSNRSTSENSALAGLNDIPWGIDAGVFGQYWPVPERFRLRFEVRQGIGGNDGLVSDFAADLVRPIGPNLVLSAGPRLSLGDTTYMRNNFGITPQEAAANGSLPPYAIGSGLKSVGFVVGASYQFADTMGLQVYDKFERLVGDAADSPIVAYIGTANQNTVGIVLTRSFQIGF